MNRQVSLGIMMLIFLAISLFSIRLAMQPAVIHTESFDMFGRSQGESAFADNAYSVLGLGLRSKAWLEYPTYNIGLAIIAVFGFIGAGLACREMFIVYNDKKLLTEALESKITGDVED